MSTPLSLRIDANYIMMHSCPSIGVEVALFINLSIHQEMELCLYVSSLVNKPYDHWSVAVVTVTVHYPFFPTFDFFKKYVAFCTGFNLLTSIFCYPIL